MDWGSLLWAAWWMDRQEERRHKELLRSVRTARPVVIESRPEPLGLAAPDEDDEAAGDISLEAALAELEALLEEEAFDEAISAATRLLASEPLEPDEEATCLYVRGQAFLLQGRLEEAADDSRALAELPLPPGGIAAARLREAAALCWLGRHDDAIVSANRALKLADSPQLIGMIRKVRAEAFAARGWAMKALGEYETALAELDASGPPPAGDELASVRHFLRWDRARLLVRLERPEEAMIDLAAALALNPASWTQVETVDEFIFLSEHPATERSFAAALDAARAEAPA